MKRNPIITLCALTAGLFTTPVSAYELITSWPNNTTFFEIAGLSTSDWRYSAIVDAFNEVNASSVDFTFTYGLGDSSVSSGNGENEIAFTTSQALLGGAPGVTVYWYNGNGFTETDIYMDSNVSYTSSSAKSLLWEYGGNNRPVKCTLLHEMGHALGLAHENGVYNVMGTDWTHIHVNSGAARCYFGEDAATGGRALYGGVAVQDVGVVHWKWDPTTTGAYSAHERTEIYAGNNQPFNKFTESEEPIYVVRAGDVVRLEFTYENHGTTSQIIDREFRLSTNDYITVADGLLAASSTSVAPDVPYTTSLGFTLPSWVAAGRYWVGPVIDAPNLASEANASNNATYTGIEVIDNGDFDYCGGSLYPCGHGEGDCDSDADCTGETRCVHDVGAQYGWSSTLDVCRLPDGHLDFCSPSHPCGLGQGDCDGDAECKGSLVCATNVGASYGWDPSVDVCLIPWPFP